MRLVNCRYCERATRNVSGLIEETGKDQVLETAVVLASSDVGVHFEFREVLLPNRQAVLSNQVAFCLSEQSSVDPVS